MKILIAADMEGITGVINWDQVTQGHFEYPRFRQMMTDEVNAAIAGAFAGGADEVVVADGHSRSNNILVEALDPRARLNSGSGSPFSMVEGIGPDVDGVIFVGYHARAGSLHAILDHTWSSSRVANLWLNEILVGEYGLNAAVCGHFGAPVLLMCGDQTACAQAAELLGAIETVVVKRAHGRMSAECLPPEVTHPAIRAAAEKAVRGLAAGRVPAPYKMTDPVRVTVEFFQSDMADRADKLPGAERLDGRRIAVTAPDMPTAYLAFRAAVELA